MNITETVPLFPLENESVRNPTRDCQKESDNVQCNITAIVPSCPVENEPSRVPVFTSQGELDKFLNRLIMYS